MKIRTLLLAAVAPVAAASVSHATGMVAGATEITQILNNVELSVSAGAELDQLIQQVAMVKNQIEAYKLMLQNIKDAPMIESDAVNELLASLHDLTTKGQSFAYAGSNSAEVFEKTHPTYKDVAANGMTTPELQAKYDEFNTNMRESAAATMKALEMDKKDMETRQKLLVRLRALNKSAEGQKAAIQVGNQYAEQLNEQLLSLRYLMHLQIQQQQEAIQIEHSLNSIDMAREANANAKEAEVKP